MKPSLQFIVPGEPFPAERARARAFMKDGSPKAMLYTPERTDEYENRVAHFARRALQQNPEWAEVALSDTKFRVHLHFVTSLPRGDLDNFKKAALDGMKRANQYTYSLPRVVKGKLVTTKKKFVSGVYKDDVRVVQALTSILRTTEKELRTEIMVEPAGDSEVPLWMELAIENGWAPRSMMQGSVT